MRDILESLARRRDLSPEQVSRAMNTIMDGEATPAQIGGFLMGLRVKGETVEEIAAAATVMRERAVPVEVHQDHLIDTCGTGGDGRSTFNVSTACAFVAAVAGARVAKHGNRSVSSSSGSADVLEAAGVRLDLTPEQVAECIRRFGVGFLFAPAHHGATRHAVGPRKELGVRTLFNLLGPMTNPASAPNQVMGVYSDRWVRPVAEVLGRLGSRHVMVVHSEDGMDEISTEAPTHVAELKDGEVVEWTLNPGDYNVEPSGLDQVVADTAQGSLQLIREALTSSKGPAADLVALNAGAAIFVAGLTTNLIGGIALARQIQSAGSAWATLRELAAHTQSL